MRALLAWLACASPQPADSSPPEAATVADAGPDLTVAVGVEAELDGSGSVGASFLWDLGDGTLAEGAVVRHAWTRPGDHVAVLQVTGAHGERVTDSARVRVVVPPMDPPPRGSSTLALSADGALAWVVTPEADALARVTLPSLEVQHIEVCDEPMAVAVADDEVAVACGAGAALWVGGLDGVERRRVALPPGSQPRGVVGRDGRWFVALRALDAIARVEGDAVTLLDAVPDPFALVLLGDEPLAASWRSPDEGAALMGPGGARWTLAVDTRPDSDTTTGGVPNLIEQVLPSPDGGRLYVPAVQHNLRRGAFLSGQALTQDTTMTAVLVTVDATTGEELARKQLDDRGRAIAVASSPEGNTLYVLHPGTGTVTVLDAWTGSVLGSLRGLGPGARGLAVSPTGDRLYVHAWLDRTLRVHQIGAPGAEPALLGTAPLVAVEPLAPEVLLGKRLFHDAADPRITRDGYIACAHCHPDGLDDGRTWDFTDRGEGLRNTTSLEGRAGTGMGRVHWSGNFDEIQDFENDLRLHFGGTGLLSEADWAEAADPLGPPKAGRSPELDALAAYVASLERAPPSPFPAPEGGAAAFEAAGCPACHPAPTYTDSTLDAPLRHDVGTLWEGSGGRLGQPLDGLDTPTLLGVWDTPPYLHDGSAATLEDAIRAHRIDLDGVDPALLAAFVASL